MTGRVNRAQEVTAAARNMRKAGQDRREKESLPENYYFVCSDLGHM